MEYHHLYMYGISYGFMWFYKPRIRFSCRPEEVALLNHGHGPGCHGTPSQHHFQKAWIPISPRWELIKFLSSPHDVRFRLYISVFGLQTCFATRHIQAGSEKEPNVPSLGWWYLPHIRVAMAGHGKLGDGWRIYHLLHSKASAISERSKKKEPKQYSGGH